MEKQPCVYMLASGVNGTLYIGVTSNLIGRVYQHREKLVDGFTQRYDITVLVWYELHEQMESAILREKQLKKWSRVAKKRLIELGNPKWQDLWTNLT
jgi:putative endonuclease